MLKIIKLFKWVNITYLLLGIILLFHALILTKLIFFPYPELFIYPYLINQGLAPYSQILDQHFPGLMFLPINLDNLGMNTPEIARLWLMGIVLITQILLFFISKEIFKSNKKSLLVNILYLIWQPFFEGWALWIDSFLPLILIPAFYFLHKKWIFLTGLLLGIAVVFKQVIIPLAGLVFLYLVWQKRDTKTVSFFLLGLVGPIGVMMLYLFYIGVLGDFWYWTVIFNLTTYAQSGRGAGPTFAHLSRALLVFGVAFIALFKLKEKQTQLLIIFLVGTLFGLSTRFDFLHFQPALPFAILATFFGVERLWNLKKIKAVVLIYLLITVWWLVIFYKGHISDKIFFFDESTYDIAGKIMEYTKPGEKVFVFGAAPHLYQMSHTLPAGDVFVFQFPWFLNVAGNRILEGIKKDQPEIIVSDRTVDIEGNKLVDFAREIDQYIQENYYQIDKIGTTEIRERKD